VSWKVKAVTVVGLDDLMLVQFSRARLVVGLRNRRVCFVHTSYRPHDTIYRLFFAMTSSFVWSKDMVEDSGKWIPKACSCFQRAGHGIILVVGTDIYWFNEDMSMKMPPIERATYYEALQEVLLMVGALDMKSIAKLQGEEV
jgi:hypothetical protein